MALLYIKPPKGNIEFNKLCDYVKKRLIFLHFLKGKSVEEIARGIVEETLAGCSESLIEGSLKDRISHYILRLLCCTHSELRSFFIQSETELFFYRLYFYDISNIKKLMKDAIRHSTEVLKHRFVTKSYKSILKSLMEVAQELKDGSGGKIVKVPFTAALNFVEKRLYPLNGGYIEVPLHALKHLLALIFEEMLVQGLNQIKYSDCAHELKDHRMQYMVQEMKRWLKSNMNVTDTLLNTAIREENLNHESVNFPPCMANLHLLLRRNHRLQHNSRVQYILYLKEIGVPCQEAISLFKKEYSIPVSDKQKPNSKTCNHSWDDSENRYIYSIEHLYGKRGSRKNYRAHSCKALQTSGNSSDGGCPFACFDENNLVKILKPCSFEVKDIEDIKSLAFEKKYTEACYFHILLKMKSASTLDMYRQHNLKTSNQDEKINYVEKNFCFPDCRKSMCGVNFNGCITNLSMRECMKPSKFFFLLKNFKESTDPLPATIS